VLAVLTIKYRQIDVLWKIIFRICMIYWNYG